MTAIITDALKSKLLDTVYDEYKAGTIKYYIGIGKSEQWDSSETVPAATNSLRTIRNSRLSLQSIKLAQDVSYVIPRNNWSSGTVYTAYDDAYSEYPTNAYYVLTEDNQIYICLQAGIDTNGDAVASTVKPTGTTTTPLRTSDGYVWKFLYSLSGVSSSRFLSANFLPVEKIEDSAGDPGLNVIQSQQVGIQNAASAGQVIGVKMLTGGAGYTSAPTVAIDGDGAGATATATVSGGVVTKIELDSSSDSGMSMGSGYHFAGIRLTGGGSSTTATARAILGPDSGIGANPIKDLRSTSLMFNSKPSGTEGGDFIVNQDFRQIALIRKPTLFADSAYTATSGKVVRYLHLTSQADAANFVVDRTITGGASSAKAIIDQVDSDKIYAHQTEDTGFISFQEAEAVTSPGGTGTLKAAAFDADSDAFTNEDVNKFGGEILYVENRSPVRRDASQTEDIKIVISL